MNNNKYNFNDEIVDALNNVDMIPTTEPNPIPGVPGRLFIVTSEQKKEMAQIVETLDSLSESELGAMTDDERLYYSTLLCNADRVLKNCITG